MSAASEKEVKCSNTPPLYFLNRAKLQAEKRKKEKARLRAKQRRQEKAIELK